MMQSPQHSWGASGIPPPETPEMLRRDSYSRALGRAPRAPVPAPVSSSLSQISESPGVRHTSPQKQPVHELHLRRSSGAVPAAGSRTALLMEEHREFQRRHSQDSLGNQLPPQSIDARHDHDYRYHHQQHHQQQQKHTLHTRHRVTEFEELNPNEDTSMYAEIQAGNSDGPVGIGGLDKAATMALARRPSDDELAVATTSDGAEHPGLVRCDSMKAIDAKMSKMLRCFIRDRGTVPNAVEHAQLLTAVLAQRYLPESYDDMRRESGGPARLAIETGDSRRRPMALTAAGEIPHASDDNNNNYNNNGDDGAPTEANERALAVRPPVSSLADGLPFPQLSRRAASIHPNELAGERLEENVSDMANYVFGVLQDRKQQERREQTLALASHNNNNNNNNNTGDDEEGGDGNPHLRSAARKGSAGRLALADSSNRNRELAAPSPSPGLKALVYSANVLQSQVRETAAPPSPTKRAESRTTADGAPPPSAPGTPAAGSQTPLHRRFSRTPAAARSSSVRHRLADERQRPQPSRRASDSEMQRQLDSINSRIADAFSRIEQRSLHSTQAASGSLQRLQSELAAANERLAAMRDARRSKRHLPTTSSAARAVLAKFRALDIEHPRAASDQNLCRRPSSNAPAPAPTPRAPVAAQDDVPSTVWECVI